MKKIDSILCVLGDDPGSTDVLRRAVALAQTSQASLTAVMIAPRAGIFRFFDGGGLDPGEIEHAIHARLLERLEQWIEPFAASVDIERRILKGTPFLQIVREVLSHDFDLVIKVPDDEDFLDGLLGSDDMHLLRKCPCPLWLARPQKAKSYNRILATVDVSDAYPPPEVESRRALNRAVIEFASAMAIAEEAELHVAHAWTAIGEEVLRGGALRTPEKQIGKYVEQVKKSRQRALDELLNDMPGDPVRQALARLEPQIHLIKGEARREIPLLARKIDADLLVIGTVARTGIPGLIIGSTAESVLRQVHCSVLAIKPPGFETPVRLPDE